MCRGFLHGCKSVVLASVEVTLDGVSHKSNMLATSPKIKSLALSKIACPAWPPCSCDALFSERLGHNANAFGKKRATAGKYLHCNHVCAS